MTYAPAPWVGTPRDEYLRILQLTGVMPLSSQMIRPTSSATHWTPPDSAPWRAPWTRWYRDDTTHSDARPVRVTAYDADVRVVYNSTFAYGTNDGPMWAGRGYSAEETIGARVQYGPVTLDLAPTYTWSENRSFELGWQWLDTAIAKPWADQFNRLGIDRPQRFGDKALSVWDPGSSAITVSGRGARFGVTARNMWWGPGIDQTILMTNNAAGFPHVFLGTDRPVSIGIGNLEALWVVGTLSQSDYWHWARDTMPRDRWLNGATFVFEPRGAPGMYFGFSRVFYEYQKYSPIRAGEILSLLGNTSEGHLPFKRSKFAQRRDQMMSLSWRGVFPDAGFEAYAEWGRNEFNRSARTALEQLDNGQGTVLGARKVFHVRDGVLSLRVETTNLENSITSFVDGSAIWYMNRFVPQGYTQRGQLIGAASGPSSKQETFALDWFHQRGRLGFLAQRMRGNTEGGLLAGLPGHPWDTILGGGPSLTWFGGGFQLNVAYTFQYEFNRDTRANNDARNHHVELRVEVPL